MKNQPQTKALSEGVMIAVSALLATSDNVAGQGMSKTLSTAQNGGGSFASVGGGVLGCFGFESGLYAEGSVRAGVLRNKYDSNDLRDEYGRSAEYWMNTPYFSAHAGWAMRHSLAVATLLIVRLNSSILT